MGITLSHLKPLPPHFSLTCQSTLDCVTHLCTCVSFSNWDGTLEVVYLDFLLGCDFVKLFYLGQWG